MFQLKFVFLVVAVIVAVIFLAKIIIVVNRADLAIGFHFNALNLALNLDFSVCLWQT